ncbi:MAG: hypothetical protein O9294_18000 [Cytophagales bacterium]|jgi:hypothetical protein|nr:hypothetical protein [Cytophagales bacterium]
MNILKRLFSKDKTPDKTDNGWTMFSTSKEEVRKLLVDLGQVTIGQDTITFADYPFEPSKAFKQATFKQSDIDDIDATGHPPTIKVGDELLFVSAKQKDDLIKFVADNKIKTVDRIDIWSWILEPFLDTEFTVETDQRLTNLLENYGLTVDKVKTLRAEVETQMLKYNFDTMLWEWCELGVSDVLSAMRTKYDKEQYREFYKRAMEIALTNKLTQ